ASVSRSSTAPCNSTTARSRCSRCPAAARRSDCCCGRCSRRRSCDRWPGRSASAMSKLKPRQPRPLRHNGRDVPRPLHLLLLFVALAGVSACTRTEARTVPPVALMVPPSPPRIPIPVPLPEPIVEAEEPEPEPEEAPAAPSRTRVEVPATRPAAERPSPPPAAVNTETRAPALQTTAN